jgi:hypothetical protein
MATLGDDLDKLGLLERREEILSRRLKTAKRDRVEWENGVYDRMIAEGWEPNESSFNRNGIRFRPKSVPYATVQNIDLLLPWLREHEGHIPDSPENGLAKIHLSKGELNRIVREKLDNNEKLPPGLGAHIKTEVAKSGIMAERADDTETQEDEDEG